MERFKLGKFRQFLITFLSFVILGACFKVMVLVEGLTEVRPVNAIPVPAGLFFGTIAGLACALGNLFSDVFGTLTASSVLGFIGNFIAAYMPYKLWHLYSKESPNIHGFRKLLLYLWVTFVSAAAVSWMIATGIWLVFHSWVPNLALIIFMNDFVFPILFGLPVFIVLTSDSVRIECAKRPKDLLPIGAKGRKMMTVIYAVFLTVLLVLTHLGGEGYVTIATVLSIPAVVLTVCLML